MAWTRWTKRSGRATAAASAPAVAAPLIARPAVTASVPAPTSHATRLPGRPSTTTATGSGSGQAASPSVAAPAGSRVVTFVNRVAQTIWVAASPFTCTGECSYRITFGLTPGG